MLSISNVYNYHFSLGLESPPLLETSSVGVLEALDRQYSVPQEIQQLSTTSAVTASNNGTVNVFVTNALSFENSAFSAIFCRGMYVLFFKPDYISPLNSPLKVVVILVTYVWTLVLQATWRTVNR